MASKQKLSARSQPDDPKHKKKVNWHHYLVYNSMTNVSHRVRNPHEQNEGQARRLPIASQLLQPNHLDGMEKTHYLLHRWRNPYVKFPRVIEKPRYQATTVLVAWSPWTSWAPWILSNLLHLQGASLTVISLRVRETISKELTDKIPKLVTVEDPRLSSGNSKILSRRLPVLEKLSRGESISAVDYMSVTSSRNCQSLELVTQTLVERL